MLNVRTIHTDGIHSAEERKHAWMVDVNFDNPVSVIGNTAAIYHRMGIAMWIKNSDGTYTRKDYAYSNGRLFTIYISTYAAK